MRIQFPGQIDQFRSGYTVEQYNRQIADNRFDLQSVPYLLDAIERKIGADGSTDTRSLDYRVARSEAGLAALHAGMAALTFPPATGESNSLLGVSAPGSAYELKTLSGTPNQVSVAHGANTITLATPQDIHTGAAPAFAGLTLTGDVSHNAGTYAAFKDAGGIATMGIYNSNSLGWLDIVYDLGGGSESTVASFRGTGLALPGMTAGSIPFIGAGGLLTQNNGTLYWDNVNGRLGINCIPSTREFELIGSVIQGTRYSNTSGNNFAGLFRRARGTTPGSAAIVQNGDSLAAVQFEGYDGTAFQAAALIRAKVEGTPNTNVMPGKLVFLTNPGGASMALVERMEITTAGFVAFNEITANPTTTELTSLNKFAIYMKADKFVIAYNNAGSITYISIPMDGSTTTWAHSTTAP